MNLATLVAMQAPAHTVAAVSIETVAKGTLRKQLLGCKRNRVNWVVTDVVSESVCALHCTDGVLESSCGRPDLQATWKF
jgi:hypothetical protein